MHINYIHLSSFNLYYTSKIHIKNWNNKHSNMIVWFVMFLHNLTDYSRKKNSMWRRGLDSASSSFSNSDLRIKVDETGTT